MDRKHKKDILNTKAIKIFHNAMYDVCWIRQMGLKIEGLIVDTMIAASLVDENRFRYDLNSLSWDYLGHGKSEAALNEAAKSRGLDPKADLWQLPAMEVGSRRERCRIDFRTLANFKKEIIYQDIESVFNLETDHISLSGRHVRFLGVKVDVKKAHELKKATPITRTAVTAKHKSTIEDVQIWAARSIEKVFQKLEPTLRKEPQNKFSIIY